jgi:DNA-binding PadR family transcriptional regulator
MSRPDSITDPHLPLKALDFSVLLVLSEGEQYGYGLVKRIAEAEAGGIRLAPSNLYYVLDRMMAAGLVEETEAGADGEEDDRRRRWYRITTLGRRVLEAEAERLSAVVRTAERLRLVSGREA